MLKTTCRLLLLLFWIGLATRGAAQQGPYDWDESRELYPGIHQAHVEVSLPRRMTINCLRIDTRTPGLRFCTTPRAEAWAADAAETQRQTTRDFIRQSRATDRPVAAAINADAFSPWPAPWNEATLTNLRGLAVADGTLVSPGSGSPSLLVDESGSVRIAPTTADTDLAGIQIAVSGFGLCLLDGTALPGGEALHPRTGIGVCRDHRFAYWITIDGRRRTTAGATTEELGSWLGHFGAYTGINMDGGGSTTLAWWDSTATGEDKCRLLNAPVGSGMRYESETAERLYLPTERANGNHLGVYYVNDVKAERETISLDGTWDIAESQSADEIPVAFAHRGPVPGLTNLATPAFPQVDAFLSREQLANRIRWKLSPPEWLTEYWQGKVDQDRDYFWYRRTFHAPTPRGVAVLKINKAQFGTAVWLNGRKLGEYAGCFTASYFHLEEAIRWNEENTLLVRIGAHPAVLPDTFPAGSDFEKIKWTPGIYDSVSLIFCDQPRIDTIQVAPRIASGEITVQTRLENRGPATVAASLTHTVKTWQGGQQVATSAPQSLSLAPGEVQVVRQSIAIPHARLWSPEDPFLYVLESSSGGDSAVTRFGMREFRFDAETKRAYLNGKVYYLRGSNITLHRFFEDPLCQDLPWQDAWVRKLLGERAKQMHWNYFRFCIGPVPDRWLEICDEVGLLIQNEFFVWTGGPGWYQGYRRTHDADEMIRQYGDWMRDNGNHPSVVVWDANNETKDEAFGSRIIPAVRPLDLSNRPWENSYNPPADPHDPVEYHPYLMSGGYFGELKFKMSDLESMDGKPRPGALPSDRHPVLINEYGWLWLNRDGSPTRLTERVYEQLLGPDATARQRLDMWAYLLAGKTEFWRAHRQYAGIIHFVYLTCSYPGVYTSDHFRDVTRLELDPAFADYVGEAFKPLGVYLNFFQPQLAAGSSRSFQVMLVNDHPQPVRGRLVLSLEGEFGATLAQADQRFDLTAGGEGRYELSLTVPAASGPCLLKATATPDGDGQIGATASRRRLTVE